jgi:hypothetical protein
MFVPTVGTFGIKAGFLTCTTGLSSRRSLGVVAVMVVIGEPATAIEAAPNTLIVTSTIRFNISLSPSFHRFCCRRVQP